MKKIGYFIFPLLVLTLSSCKTENGAPLKAEFDYSTDHAMVGEEISFNDRSSGSPSRWTWYFEGAEEETSVLTQPVVRWLDAGRYTVSLKVSNKEYSDEIVKEKIITIDYHHTVKADFSIDKTMAFDNEYIAFTNLSEGFPNNVKWTFTPEGEGEPVVSEEKEPVLMFSPGIYSVKMEVSNPLDSDVKEVKDAFTVLDQYAVMSDFTALNTTTYEGGKVYFRSSATGNVQGYEWSFEGGSPASSTEPEPVVTYSAPGKYKVSLRVYNDKFEDIEEREGVINVVPTFNSMVFMLPFDGDIKDYGPYGLHPSLYSKGGLVHTYEEGYSSGLGKSIRFPGGEKGKSYAVLQMPEDLLVNYYPQGSEMTLSLWTKISSVSANTAVFAQGNCPGTGEGTNANQIWGRFQSGHSFRVTAEKTGVSGNTVTAKDDRFDDGEWHHLAVVYDRTDNDGEMQMVLTIYLDGNVVGSPAKGADKDTYTIPYFIGSNLRFTNGAWAPENMFNGLMDDYILYNAALTEEQVKELATK